MSFEALQRFVDGIDPAFRDGDAEVDGKHAEACNVDLLREQYQALSSGDLDAAVDMFHEEVELEITGPPTIPFLGRWRGRPAVKEAMLRNFAMLDAQAPEVHSVVAQGDLVVVIGHEQGRIRATDSPYSVHWVHIVTFRDGKIVRFREIVDGYAMEA